MERPMIFTLLYRLSFCLVLMENEMPQPEKYQGRVSQEMSDSAFVVITALGPFFGTPCTFKVKTQNQEDTVC